jgi:hypothetical protein
MAISIIPPASSSSGSSSASNDFTLNLGTSGYTKATLDTTFPAGSYVVTSTNLDSTLDIYLLASDGTVAGLVNAGATSFTVTATKEFNTVVVYGGTSNEALSFVFKYVFNTSVNSTTDFASVGPRIISITPSSLPNVNDTIAITGQNFATDVAITFTGTDLVARNAKSIVRGSSTSLTVTRPDDMPIGYNPYTITSTNPGVTSPTSSNAHKSINSVSAGAAPVWVTTSPIHYDFGTAWNGGSLSATDIDGGSSVTYTVVSGSLPSGITLSSSGVFTGTPTTSQVSASIRATDSGGNYVDRTFLFNKKPVWVTTSLAQATQGSAYSQTLSAGDETSISSYTLVSGTLPTGLSLNTSTGAITGTPSSGNGNSNLTFRATDSNGGTQDKVLTIGTLTYFDFTANGSWTAPAGISSVTALVVAGGGGGAYGSYGGHGGGGAGGVQYTTSLTVTPTTTYAITIGGGGGSSTSGSPSSIGSVLVSTGGGRGGGNSTTNSNGGTTTAASGGSGGGGGGDSGAGSASSGAWRNAGSGISGQGNSGGSVTDGFAGGGGGGKGSAGSSGSGGNGASYTIAGITYNVGGGGFGGANGNTVASSIWGGAGQQPGSPLSGGVNQGGGGAGQNSNNGGATGGGSGRVVISYVG